MTPQQIAREAAEAVAMQAVFEAYPGLQTGLSEDTAEAYRLRAIILTAAAKMVRESGAEGALMFADAIGYWTDDYGNHHPTDHALRCRAALGKLRAIGEQENP